MQKQLEDAANLNCPPNIINNFNRDAVEESPSSEYPRQCEGYENDDSTDEHSDSVHKSLLNNSTCSKRVQQPTMIIKTENEIPEVDRYNPSSIRQPTFNDGRHQISNTVQQPTMIVKTEIQVHENDCYNHGSVLDQLMYDESSSDSDGQHISKTVHQPMIRNDNKGTAHQPTFGNDSKGPMEAHSTDSALNNSTYSKRVQQPTMIIKTENEIPEVGRYNPSSIRQPTFDDGRYQIPNTVQQPTMIVKTEIQVDENDRYKHGSVREQPTRVYDESSSDSDGQHISNTAHQPMFRNDNEPSKHKSVGPALCQHWHNRKRYWQSVGPALRSNWEGLVHQPTFGNDSKGAMEAHSTDSAVHQPAFRNDSEDPASAHQPTFSNEREGPRNVSHSRYFSSASDQHN